LPPGIWAHEKDHTVPKRRQRRDQQHLNQQSKTRRSYQLGGTEPAEKFKPPFPMNLMQNTRLFFIVGAVIMVGSVIAAAVLASQPATDSSAVDPLESTPTATVDPSVSATAAPSVSPTPQRSFPQADTVIDPAKQYTATLKTAKGDIVIRLFADKAPRTVNSFVFLAGKQYFDGLTFHRVVKDFVIQGGDPRGDGTGGPGYETEEDQNDLMNMKGFVSMAKSAGATKFGSQFFINLKDNPALDQDSPGQKRFYPFGEVISGMDVAERIEAKDVIQTVTIDEK
jgi:cyclophilin family peptidyl-prolyl cis-trans isomerase